MTLPLLVTNVNMFSSPVAHQGLKEAATTTKNNLSAHPSQIIIVTAKHASTELWKPFRGSFSMPCLFQNEGNLLLFQLAPAKSAGKERNENELSALLKRFMISHTHWQQEPCQTPHGSLADLRPGASPTAEQQLRLSRPSGSHRDLCSPTPCSEKGQFGQAWVQLAPWILSESVLCSELLEI